MKKTLGIGIVSVLLGLVLLAFCATDAYSLIFKKSNLEDMSYGTIEKGDIAQGDIKYVVAKLGTVEESRHLFFIPLGSDETALYLIADNGGYVTVSIRNDIADYDEITAQTAEYLAGRAESTSVSHSFLGIARKITDDQLEILNRHFAEKNLSDSDWQYAVSSMVLEEFDVTMTVIELSICCVLILAGIILLMISRRYRFGDTVYVGEKSPEDHGETEKKEDAQSSSDEEGSEE